MTTFVIAASLLTALALLILLPGLLRKPSARAPHAGRAEVNLMVLRDQLRELDADQARGVIDAEGYASARAELERRVAEDVQPATPAAAAIDKRWTAAAVALMVPALAAALYLMIGTPAGLDPQQVKPQEASHALTEAQIVAMVDGLSQRLKSKPDDIEGWSMLARSYNALGRFAEASDAYARLVKLVPDDAGLLADYADTLAMASNKSLEGAPEQLVMRALAIDPKNIKALALAGSASFARRDYQAAIDQWQKLMLVVPAGSEMANSTASGIAEAKGLMSGTGAPATPMPAAVPPAADAPIPAAAAAAAPSGATVAGSVELAPALLAKVSPGDTVFIFARAADGPRFPLAALRKQVKDLPATFVLDDSMSMVPTAKLSSFPMVVVGARISKSGNATPAAGDLEGLSAPVAPGAAGLKIVIDRVR